MDDLVRDVVMFLIDKVTGSSDTILQVNMSGFSVDEAELLCTHVPTMMAEESSIHSCAITATLDRDDGGEGGTSSLIAMVYPVMDPILIGLDISTRLENTDISVQNQAFKAASFVDLETLEIYTNEIADTIKCVLRCSPDWVFDNPTVTEDPDTGNASVYLSFDRK